MKCVVSAVAAFSVVAALSACSSSTDDPSPATGGTNQGTCNAAMLVGTWSGGPNFHMKILSDLTYQASGTPNFGQIEVNGTLQVSGCTVKITDVSGKGACQLTQVGDYTFTVSAKTVTFTAVSDACDGRRIPLSGKPLTKQ